MNNKMIDKAIVERVRNADIIDFFEKHHGFTFAQRGGEYRCHQHPSLAIKKNRLSFYWHSKGIGGHGVLDYLTKVENMPFRDAVDVVIKTTFIPTIVAPSAPVPTQPRQPQPEKPKVLVLPEKAGIPLKLLTYLCTKRGIDSDIVNTLMQKEMLYEDRRGNVVFVGHDEQGKARFASLRGTYGDCSFRGDCSGSDKRYGFNMAAAAPSERLYIFESAIDAMSHASLENAIAGNAEAWQQHNRLSLSGTTDTAIPFFLNQHNTVKELIFCLDSDTAGREAAVAMARKYTDKGYYARLELPQGKDFNEDLQAHKQQIKAEKRTLKQHKNVSI